MRKRRYYPPPKKKEPYVVELKRKADFLYLDRASKSGVPWLYANTTGWKDECLPDHLDRLYDANFRAFRDAGYLRREVDPKDSEDDLEFLTDWGREQFEKAKATVDDTRINPFADAMLKERSK